MKATELNLRLSLNLKRLKDKPDLRLHVAKLTVDSYFPMPNVAAVDRKDTVMSCL